MIDIKMIHYILRVWHRIWFIPGRGGPTTLKKRFNVNGLCYPEKHYMVNLDGRLEEIKKLVDYGDYFVINRARQFGKTTILYALKKYLQDDYIVISTSFQGLSAAKFENESVFCSAFAEMVLENLWVDEKVVPGISVDELMELKRAAESSQTLDMVVLFQYLRNICKTSEKPLVLLIDEIDSASNNQVFLDFLGLLRDYYLKREEVAAFQSVILAGVYDIKNLRQRIRPEGEHKYNSPWNIAADFDIDMSFSVTDIAGMLGDYERDHQTGMNITKIAGLIYNYTSGYPYLVSRICKIIDEKLDTQSWNQEGVLAAVKELLSESNTLFDDMRKKIADLPELRNMLYAILFTGQKIPYNPDNFAIDMGSMFGFIRNENGDVAISNRIFETRMYNFFLSEELLNNVTYNASLQNRNQFIQDGCLNMDFVMQKFVEHYTEVYADSEERFLEENGRRLFLLYLKPIINGTGNYYIESRTRDLKRTDIIVDYLGKQYVIEMKIWHGEEYNHRGEKQLADYLDAYHLEKGYLLSFNFNKNKKTGIHTITCGEKTILEAVV